MHLSYRYLSVPFILCSLACFGMGGTLILLSQHRETLPEVPGSQRVTTAHTTTAKPAKNGSLVNREYGDPGLSSARLSGGGPVADKVREGEEEDSAKEAALPHRRLEYEDDKGKDPGRSGPLTPEEVLEEENEIRSPLFLQGMLLMVPALLLLAAGMLSLLLGGDEDPNGNAQQQKKKTTAAASAAAAARSKPAPAKLAAKSSTAAPTSTASAASNDKKT